MSAATAVVVVSRVGKITAGEAENLREQLERIDAPAFGLVANFAPGPGGYGYY
jgi:Mrp family chromosome partitioning ATPase